MPTDTPMMQQYHRAKAAHPDALVLFRMGDFYEMFFEDAQTASQVLGLTLTSRDKNSANPVPMAGVPHHSAEGYIARLLEAGFRVAICEQTETPATAANKGLLERKVVEVLTPGTVTNGTLLAERENRYLAALAPGREVVGVALCDVSTGELLAGEVAPGALGVLLARFPVVEVAIPDAGADPWPLEDGAETGGPAARDRGPVRTLRPAREFDAARGRERLCEQLGVVALDAFGCDDLTAGLGAAGALLRYLADTGADKVRAVATLTRLRSGDTLVIDDAALDTLEVLRSDGGRNGSLLGVLDRTCTAMGGRQLRAALRAPLLEVGRIRARQDAVQFFRDHAPIRQGVRAAFDGMGDLERLVARLATERATPRDLGVLRDALARLVLGRQAMTHPSGGGTLVDVDAAAPALPPLLAEAVAALPDARGLVQRLGEALVDDPPLTLTTGGIFRRGFHADLDALAEAARDGKRWISDLQDSERARTGIPTLKVGYNRVFGYYLEVSRGQAHRVPEDYQRKQSLVGAERFITPQLKEMESKLLGAEERAARLEHELFLALRAEAASHVAALRAGALAVAWIDVLAALAEVAESRGYVRPEVDDSELLEIDEGRHPVVDALLGNGQFVPNDTRLGTTDRRLSLVTGPNMAGKSTFLRQVGLIVLLAQVGACVPAARARIGVADRLFTRVGASDAIARGRSTFLVEMIETATILRGATSRSLVLLDEIGRGTSTYDGLSIAWAVTEYLLAAPGGAPRALFATHYHELTHLAGALPGLSTLNVLVKEWGNRVIFLRRIVEGAADRSYGIHVAQLAGLPEAVIQRARAILEHLEAGMSAETVPLPHGATAAPRTAERARSAAADADQIGLFAAPPAARNGTASAHAAAASEAMLAELRQRLDALDVNTLTPLAALNALAELRERFGSLA